MTDFSASFVARSLPALLDGAHVRASNGTDIALDGTLSVVSSNVPAFDRDRGVRLEAGATQLLYNTGFAGAVTGTPGTLPTAWSRGSGGVGGSKEVIAIDLGNAIRFTTIGNADREYLQQTVTLTAGTIYTFSFVLEVETAGSKYQDWVSVIEVSGTRGSIVYRLNGAAASALDVLPVGVHTIEYQFTCTGSGTFLVRCGAGVNGGVIGGAAGVVKYPQCENNSFRTSYIYNTSTSATLIRQPSYISSTLSALGIAEQTNEYSFSVGVRLHYPTSISGLNLVILALYSTSGTEWLRLYAGGNGAFELYKRSQGHDTFVAVNLGTSLVPGDMVHLSVTANSSELRIVANNLTSASVVSAAVENFTNPLTKYIINQNPAGGLNGHFTYAGFRVWDTALSQAELEALDASMFDPVVTLDGITYPATVTGSNQVSITVAGIGEFDAAGDHAATPWYENVPVTLAIGDESASSTLQIVAPVPDNFGTAGASPVYPPVGLSIGDDVYVDKVSGAGTADPEGVNYIAATASVVRFRAFDQNSGLWLAYREELIPASSGERRYRVYVGISVGV